MIMVVKQHEKYTLSLQCNFSNKDFQFFKMFNISYLFAWCTFLYLIDKIFVVQICERSICFSATVECINEY